VGKVSGMDQPSQLSLPSLRGRLIV